MSSFHTFLRNETILKVTNRRWNIYFRICKHSGNQSPDIHIRSRYSDNDLKHFGDFLTGAVIREDLFHSFTVLNPLIPFIFLDIPHFFRANLKRCSISEWQPIIPLKGLPHAVKMKCLPNRQDEVCSESIKQFNPGLKVSHII